MDNKKIAQELVAVARDLMAAKKPKYTSSDIDKVIKELRGYVKRGGRDYGDYQFNIKLMMINIPDSVMEEYGESTASDFSTEEAAMPVWNLGGEVRRRFGWVKDWTQAGRSGGWFCILDGDSTMDGLESAYLPAETLERFDKLQENERGVWYRSSPWDKDELWNELTEEVKGAVEDGRQKVRDLGEIEKMVKSGIADFKKDMESEQWWESALG